MRKMIGCTVLLLLTVSSFSQQTNPNRPLVREDYLAKSKSQKTAAWILLGVGVTMIAIAAPGDVSFELLPVLAIGGTAAILGSVPLFIAAGRNKRKANATTYLEIKRNPVPAPDELALRYFPALSLKFRF